MLPAVGEEDFRFFLEAARAQEVFRLILSELFVLPAVEAVLAAEVRNAALGGDAGAAQEDDALAFLQDGVQGAQLIRAAGYSSSLLPVCSHRAASSNVSPVRR